MASLANGLLFESEMKRLAEVTDGSGQHSLHAQSTKGLLVLGYNRYEYLIVQG